jgi:hypothetical protein
MSRQVGPRLTPEVGVELELLMTIPGGTSSVATGEWTSTQVPTYQRFCKISMLRGLTIGWCAPVTWPRFESLHGSRIPSSG